MATIGNFRLVPPKNQHITTGASDPSYVTRAPLAVTVKAIRHLVGWASNLSISGRKTFLQNDSEPVSFFSSWPRELERIILGNCNPMVSYFPFILPGFLIFFFCFYFQGVAILVDSEITLSLRWKMCSFSNSKWSAIYFHDVRECTAH